MASSPTPDIAARIRVRRADAADAGALSEFAERVFRETLEANNDPVDLAAYLAEAFGVDRQRAELGEPGAVVLLAEEVAGTSDDGSEAAAPIAGYSHLTLGETPDSMVGPDPVELKRFYIDRAWQGAGLAQML